MYRIPSVTLNQIKFGDAVEQSHVNVDAGMSSSAADEHSHPKNSPPIISLREAESIADSDRDSCTQFNFPGLSATKTGKTGNFGGMSATNVHILMPECIADLVAGTSQACLGGICELGF